MSYKSKTTAVGEYKGGAVEPANPKPRLRYPCFADNCPMPGTMWTTRLGDDKGKGGNADPTPGACPFHYNANPSDIPRITSVLLQWDCVAQEVQAARRSLTGPHASDPGWQAREFDAAWQRLQPIATGWEAELKPGNVRSSAGVERPFRETYGDWSRRLERFIGARVVEVLSTNQRRAA